MNDGGGNAFILSSIMRLSTREEEFREITLINSSSLTPILIRRLSIVTPRGIVRLKEGDEKKRRKR